MVIRTAIQTCLVLSSTLWSIAALALSGSELELRAHELISDKVTELEEKGFRVESELGKVSPHLQLHQCEVDLKLELKRDVYIASNNSVDISCQAPNWRVYIPVEIRIFSNVLSAKMSIPKGATLSSRSLEYTEQQVNAANYGSYRDIKSVSGMIAKRTIKQGSVIKPSHLKAPMLVARGDHVLISASNDALNIQMKGEALNSGALGEQISVKNLSSDRVIRARVVDRGRVAVLL